MPKTWVGATEPQVRWIAVWAIALCSLAAGCNGRDASDPELTELRITRSIITPPDSFSFVEPSAVYAENGLHVVAIRFIPDSTPATGFFAMPGRFECRAFVSTDSAATWQTRDLPPVGFCGDPWLTRTPGGAALVTVGSENEGINGMSVYLNSGTSPWIRPVTIDGVWDRPTIATAGAELIVVGAGLEGPAHTFLLRGNAVVTRRTLGADSIRQSGSTAVVLRDGTVLAPFTDYEKAFVRRSRDTTRTWGDAVAVADGCSDPFQHLAVHTFDTAERVYLACEAVGDTVELHVSDDAGVSWRREWFAGGGDVDRGTVAVASLVQGGVAVVWQERTVSGAQSGCRALRAAFSRKAAVFDEPVTLSSAPTCPSAAANAYLLQRFPLGGDYIGVTGRNSELTVVWPVFLAGNALALEAVRVRR